ncbi:S8 family peptidase [Clostridium lacusfryxellense]|uniref:S8 family peptidase n=1 Tax=Clostridium lacusfryxellense TaxID=205328 RepID=UPI001C0D53C5|nr:S8 family peptidase [Clostridium lacusfryxellense]MBU3110189.1 S8 family peptidase [Clostridium lacusfryxellense]
MNDILQLKGQFQQKVSSSRPGPSNLPRKASVDVMHLEKIRKDMIEVLEFWEQDTILIDALVSVRYMKIAAKSNRIKGLLKGGGKIPNDCIVGAKFTGTEKKQHLITYCVSIEILKKTVVNLNKCINILHSDFDGKITCDEVEEINNKTRIYDTSVIAKSNFVNIIVDSYYIDKVLIEESSEEVEGESIITIYKTSLDTKKIMEKIGIGSLIGKMIDDTTMLLFPDQLAILKRKAPYLIAMAVSDLSSLTRDDFEFQSESTITIPKPENEPIIGVIDTLFDKNVYFTEWVEFHSTVDKELESSDKDFFHGTAVSSIIVDGASINPELDDGCGRFRVRHFGVATSGKFSSFTIMKAIRDIIEMNKDIKVWNLSLGSVMEIHDNFISPEAAELDRIQNKYDVIFVIAGTNKPNFEKKRLKIGAPADSINALVVNSVNLLGRPATYSREGLVLSFFNKPDISYYGGDGPQKIRVCTSTGEAYVAGTSFAAPWISRKMAYLIHIIGLSREAAKALIIDSAVGWKKTEDPSNLIGYGVVPKRIEDIVQSPNDEIRFILSGVSEKYDTYNFNIPVPIYKEKHPFVAKATLCYFPKCSRTQGVDYTNTELDLHFGRIKDSGIKSINGNQQSVEGGHYLFEEDARKYFRKWDNVKHINEELKNGTRGKKAYNNGLWGISIKTKERLSKRDGEGLKFSVVVTLKEINGVNRIEDFIHQCSFRGWLVNRINVDNYIEIYNKAEEEISFD